MKRKYPASKKYTKSKGFKPAVKKVVLQLAEKKHIRQDVVAFSPAVNSKATWYIANLFCTTTATAADNGTTGIVQGNAENMRIGERTRNSKLTVFVTISPLIKTTATGGTTCRVIIFHDKEPHLGYPNPSLIMDPNNDYAGVRNLTQAKRFTVMKDFVHEMVPTIAVSTGVPSGFGPKFVSQFVFYPKTVTEWSGQAGVTANIIKHGYFVMFCSDADDCCTVGIRSLVEFTDD